MAIVRTSSLEKIVTALEDIGIMGITITNVKGTGEEVSLYRPYAIHSRIEIIAGDEKADEAVHTIVRHGKTGFAGDEIIGVYPMDYMVKIRTGEKKPE